MCANIQADCFSRFTLIQTIPAAPCTKTLPGEERRGERKEERRQKGRQYRQNEEEKRREEGHERRTGGEEMMAERGEKRGAKD